VPGTAQKQQINLENEMASTKWIKGLVLAASTLIGSSCFAAVITDTVNLGSQKLADGQSISWTHNLNDNGFVLGSALSGFLSIDLKDDSRTDGAELGWVTVEKEWNFGDILFNDDGFASITLDFGTQLAASSLLRLNQDGFLDVTLTSLYGDFLAVGSALQVTTRDAAVPEPSSIALLAAGLMGIVMMRRSAARKG
jgi:hypothetical protein